VGEQQVVVRSLACDRHPPHAAKPRRTPSSSPLSRASRCAKHEHRGRGGGEGVGEQQVVVRSLACDRHPPHAAKPRRTPSAWSTALPPSSHAVSADVRSERPRSRTDGRSRGVGVCLVDRFSKNANLGLGIVRVREPAPADWLRGFRRMGRRRKRRTPGWVEACAIADCLVAWPCG
jgi:hypothetical protein